MSAENKRMESMLFDYSTTYMTSYRGGPILETVKTKYQDRKGAPSKQAPVHKDTHTLTPWKTTIPFSLLHKPKEVVRTNPYSVPRLYEPPVDVDREAVRKSRPRLVMTPAVSMDDIENEHARDILLRDMYTTNMMRSTREAVAPVQNIKAPLPKLPAPANPISLPKLQPPRVPPEWRLESASWDSRQLRGYCDPTKEFWLRQEVPKCNACQELKIADSHRKMMCKKKQIESTMKS